jgi:eukaryotic-like serine/threonine-protein kinase
VSKTILSAAVAALVLTVAASEGQQPDGPPTKRNAEKEGVQGRVAWLDRQGKLLGAGGEAGFYRTLAVSPDGKRVAAERNDPRTNNKDIWLIRIADGTSTRFTSDAGWDAFPTWSPDGSRIVFTSNRSGQFDLYEKGSDSQAGEQLLFKSAVGKGPTSWSPDGRFLMFYTLGAPTHLQVLRVPRGGTPGENGEPAPFVDVKFSSITGKFSPDGRSVVYTSNESGRNEIAVRRIDPTTGLPAATAPILVTSGGGRTPLWRGDGKEIFYMSPDGMATAVSVDTSGGIAIGSAKPLFKVPAGLLFWDVSPDGTRFFLPVPEPSN